MIEDKSKFTEIEINIETINKTINETIYVPNKILQESITISIVIPLYNEEHSIKNVINRIPNNFKNEIIIIDDGSTDNSLIKIHQINNRKIKIIQDKTDLQISNILL